MATVGQVYYNVFNPESEQYESKPTGLNIYNNIVAAYPNASRFTKLGVQAPAGAEMIINDNKNILIGSTGVYELDGDIVITSLKFVRPVESVLDETASEAKKTEGVNAIKAAEQTRESELAALSSSLTQEQYVAEYTKIQDKYMLAYKASLKTYNEGASGIYNPGETKDYNNIIVDFLWD